MKQYTVPVVAQALLILKETVETDPLRKGMFETPLAERIADSGLAVFGRTTDDSQPTKLVRNLLLKSDAEGRRVFHKGEMGYRLDDYASSFEDPRVRGAIYALIHQQPIKELRVNGIVEFTFHCGALMAVRNPEAALTRSTIERTLVDIPPLLGATTISDLIAAHASMIRLVLG